MAICTMLFAQTLRNGSNKGLNLRSEPNQNSKVLLSVPHNAKVTIVDKNNSEWYKVKYDGKTGYVSSQYLTEENNPNRNNNNNNRNSSNTSNNNTGSNKNSGSTSFKSSSVEYKTGVGVRLGGWESGITLKHFIKSNAALEGIVSTGWLYKGTRITALYEVQKSLGPTGLYWFWGLGAHIGFYNQNYWSGGNCKDGRYEYKGRWYDCGTRTAIGIDGILGIEYFFTGIPFTIGVDLKPSIDFFGRGGHFGDLALTLRYAF